MSERAGGEFLDLTGCIWCLRVYHLTASEYPSHIIVPRSKLSLISAVYYPHC